MHFDYTYIHLLGMKLFEPMVIVTNFIMFLVSIYCTRQLMKFKQPYASQMAGFIIILGISGCFGAAAHAAHYQLGNGFFNAVVFISNVLSLFSIYFCFRGSYIYYNLMRHQTPNKTLIAVVLGWIAVLLIITLINNEFTLIKIHAGIVLIYSLVVHSMAYRKGSKGSGVVVLGICISFLSIIVHSLKISIDEWFNYKDIAHVIMIISMIIIYRGIKQNTQLLVANGMQQQPA